MTALFVRGLGGPGLSPSARVASALVLMPLLPILLPVDLVLYALKFAWESIVLARSVASCPAGHVVALHGAFECPGCQLVREGHGFARCRYCRTRAEVVGCPCGRPILNPLAFGPASWL